MNSSNLVAKITREDALKRFRSLEGERDTVFDTITSLAAKTLCAPIVVLTVIDLDRIWFLSSFGIQTNQLINDEGLCASTIREEKLYLVEDAYLDPRTRNHSFVTGDIGLRFYAGMPFTSPEGYLLGTLCVMDTVPRKLSTAHSNVLRNLTRLVMKHIELRLTHLELIAKHKNPPQAQLEADQLLLTAIHDLRTPLSTVTMLSSLLAEQQVGVLNAVQEKMIHSICVACTEMASQLTQYAEYVSCDPTQLFLEKHPTDLVELVKDCISEQNINLSNSNITIDFDSKIVIPSIYIDSQKIRKVISTFLNYSIIRSNSNDTINIEIKCDESNLQIDFCDHGPSVTSAQIEMILNATSGRRGKKSKGTVPQEHFLALPIAKRLLEAHGGTIDTVAHTEGGLIVSLRLPL